MDVDLLYSSAPWFQNQPPRNRCKRTNHTTVNPNSKSWKCNLDWSINRTFIFPSRVFSEWSGGVLPAQASLGFALPSLASLADHKPTNTWRKEVRRDHKTNANMNSELGNGSSRGLIMRDTDGEMLTWISIIQADARAAAWQQGDSSWLFALLCNPRTISGEPILGKPVWHGPLCHFLGPSSSETPMSAHQIELSMGRGREDYILSQDNCRRQKYPII